MDMRIVPLKNKSEGAKSDSSYDVTVDYVHVMTHALIQSVLGQKVRTRRTELQPDH